MCHIADLELIFGGTMVALATLVPDFKNVRMLTFYALVATTFTTWYGPCMPGSSLAADLKIVDKKVNKEPAFSFLSSHSATICGPSAQGTAFVSSSTGYFCAC